MHDDDDDDGAIDDDDNDGDDEDDNGTDDDDDQNGEWIYQGRSVCDKSFRLLARNRRTGYDDDHDNDNEDTFDDNCDDGNDDDVDENSSGFIRGDQFVTSHSDCSEEETGEKGRNSAAICSSRLAVTNRGSLPYHLHITLVVSSHNWDGKAGG